MLATEPKKDLYVNIVNTCGRYVSVPEYTQDSKDISETKEKRDITCDDVSICNYEVRFL